MKNIFPFTTVGYHYRKGRGKEKKGFCGGDDVKMPAFQARERLTD